MGTSISLEDSDYILYPSITICIDPRVRPTSDRSPNVTELLEYVFTQGPNGQQGWNPEDMINKYVMRALLL